MRETKGKKKNQGVTLIALAITIIVLLILAGVTVATLTGDNGIIKNSKDAKEQTEISEEKEVVDRATVQAMGNNKRGNLIENELQDQLDKIASSGKTEVTDTGEEFEILFKESNRCYIVDRDGNIIEQQTIAKIEYAGDITKNDQYDGSKEKPYQITCIEDLVAWSNMAQGSGVIYKNGKIENISKREAFSGKYFELTRDLNFKSNYSYGNSKRTDFGDLNTNGTTETIKEELTKTDEGCIGFTPIGIYKRDNYFNGNNNTIKNIYIHRKEGTIALFSNIGEVKNLKLTGTIINDTWEAGGIAYNSASIENCINYANVTGNNFAGGICSRASNYIKDCINYGNITITGSSYGYAATGGIGGSDVQKYSNCINYGTIKGTTNCSAGICGFVGKDGEIVIESCKNYGKIEATNDLEWRATGGIVGSLGRRKFKNYKFG